MNNDVLILQDIANDLDAVSPMKATAARNGAAALKNADARRPHLRELLAELGAGDVREAVVKARKLREANGEALRELSLFSET